MDAAAERFLTERNFDKVERLSKLAADHGVTLLHLAIGGLATQPGVSSVIVGATTAEQVRANANAANWEPSVELKAAILDATATASH